MSYLGTCINVKAMNLVLNSSSNRTLPYHFNNIKVIKKLRSAPELA